ncbi:MAG: hypothetical protein DMF63_12785 [Acidobacteria bacterium]|nr:MAG: hypothetical protein DMF63_12785 [Acidobacteriota bacterium]
MKHASAIICVAILITAALGCSQFKGGDTGTTGNTTTTTAAAASPAISQDISGAYDITGMNENGAGAYKGTLMVTNREDVYQFSWDTAGKKYDGVGVQTGDGIGVAFAEGDNGKGCGVVLYKIGSDGSLNGKAGYWGNNSSETETAKRTKGTDLEGDYDVSGTNTAGQDYTGKLSVKKAGAGYTFSWNAGSPLEGFGIRQGDTVAVGIGGNKCGFVSYERKSDGTLEGKWGGYGSRSVGTETAKKK